MNAYELRAIGRIVQEVAISNQPRLPDGLPKWASSVSFHSQNAIFHLSRRDKMRRLRVSLYCVARAAPQNGWPKCLWECYFRHSRETPREKVSS
jgi:hypothetical protein